MTPSGPRHAPPVPDREPAPGGAVVAKRCTRCGGLKPLTDFYRHRFTRDRRQSRCVACIRAMAVAWNAANLDRTRQNRRECEQARASRAKWAAIAAENAREDGA